MSDPVNDLSMREVFSDLLIAAQAVPWEQRSPQLEVALSRGWTALGEIPLMDVAAAALQAAQRKMPGADELRIEVQVRYERMSVCGVLTSVGGHETLTFLPCSVVGKERFGS